MRLTQYHVDAFASCVFQGNPAAVCPLDKWLDDDLMQAIAAENNLAETAFFIKQDNHYVIRWFTPTTEVKLCGHATLASAYVLFNYLGVADDCVSFDSLSGVLHVNRIENGLLEMDFPSEVTKPVDVPDVLEQALGASILECEFEQDYVALLDSQQTVETLKPNLPLLAQLDGRGVIVTAPSDKYDFVCRFFGPKVGINEDPVTGSAFTKLVPFWSQRIRKMHFNARQVSARGGDVICALQQNRVKIAGTAVLFSQGEVYLE